MKKTIHRHGAKLCKVLYLVLLLYPSVGAADSFIPKQVYLIFDEDRIIASNIKQSRFDRIRLAAKEEVIDSSVGKAVIVVVTNRRFLAYSVDNAAWVSRDTIANERLEILDAEDFSGIVITSKRFLNFNGENGVWSESPRKKVFR